MTEVSRNDPKPKNGNLKMLASLILLGVIAASAYYMFQKNEGDTESAAKMLKKVEGDADPDNIEQWSYANGQAVGQQILASIEAQDNFSDVDKEILAQGFTDALLAREAKLSEEQVAAIYEKRSADAEARTQDQAGKNLISGQEYIASYKDQDGAVAGQDGVYYKVLTQGEGEKVGLQEVNVLYTGKTIDGTVFDSTANYGDQPSPLKSGEVIPGLGNLLQEMSVGDKYEIVIPAEQAYGPEGIPGAIEPNQTLVFEIEIIEIAPELAAPVAAPQS